MKLTAKNVKELPLPPGKSDHIEWDDDVPGFGMRIRASGARVLIFQYGRQPTRRMKLGTVGAVDFEAARRSAKDYYHKVQLGQDPAGDRAKAEAEAKAKTAESFGVILRTYLEYKRPRLKPRSIVEVERHLLVHAKPLHGLPLAKIRKEQVAPLLTRLAQTCGVVTRNRVRASLSAFFGWAFEEAITDENPVTKTRKEDEQSRDRTLEPDEIRLIWNLPKGQYRDILRLLLLTACRAKEIAALQWGEVHDDMIVLPPERRKTRKISKKKPTAHIVPLSEPARAILAAQPRSADGFVFGRVNGRPFSGWGASKIHADDVIEKAAGKPLKHWTPHDLRRTAATRMADPLGIAPYVIESCLGHVGHKAGIGGTYILSNYERDKRRALDQWGEHVMAIIEGRESNVVTLRA